MKKRKKFIEHRPFLHIYNDSNNDNNKCNMKGKEMHTGKNVLFHLLFMSYRSHCHYSSCTILLFSINIIYTLFVKIIFSSFFPQLEYTLSSSQHTIFAFGNSFTILINMRGLVFTQIKYKQLTDYHDDDNNTLN